MGFAKEAFMAEVKTMPKFDKTYCSQCGSEFGPGDSGFSHCDQHALLDRDAEEPREHWTTELARAFGHD